MYYLQILFCNNLNEEDDYGYRINNVSPRMSRTHRVISSLNCFPRISIALSFLNYFGVKHAALR